MTTKTETTTVSHRLVNLRAHTAACSCGAIYVGAGSAELRAARRAHKANADVAASRMEKAIEAVAAEKAARAEQLAKAKPAPRPRRSPRTKKATTTKPAPRSRKATGSASSATMAA